MKSQNIKCINTELARHKLNSWWNHEKESKFFVNSRNRGFMPLNSWHIREIHSEYAIQKVVFFTNSFFWNLTICSQTICSHSVALVTVHLLFQLREIPFYPLFCWIPFYPLLGLTDLSTKVIKYRFIQFSKII